MDADLNTHQLYARRCKTTNQLILTTRGTNNPDRVIKLSTDDEQRFLDFILKTRK